MNYENGMMTGGNSDTEGSQFSKGYRTHDGSTVGMSFEELARTWKAKYKKKQEDE